MKKLIAFSASIVIIFSGCGVQKNEQTVWPDSDKVSNTLEIMESENGYYFSGMESLFLQYHDKETGSEIMLCNKPECPHDGRETCVATYKNMPVSNTILYNGALYFAGVETSDETFTVSLFKTALDGSAVDKVSPLVSVKNTTDSEHAGLRYSTLTIHRGYVFINAELYNPNEIGTYSGFLGGAFCKTDLRNGKVTVIKEYTDYWDNEGKINGTIWPSGDYIFYPTETGMYRLNINSDSPEKVFTDIPDGYVFDIVASDSSTLYVKKCNEDDLYKITDEIMIMEYDPASMKCRDEYNVIGGSVIPYDSKLYITPWKSLTDNDYAASVEVYEKGKEIFRTEDLPCDKSAQASIGFNFGKIYVLRHDRNNRPAMGRTYYSCSVEKFLSGNIVWKEEFNTDQIVKRINSYMDQLLSDSSFVYSYSKY